MCSKENVFAKITKNMSNLIIPQIDMPKMDIDPGIYDDMAQTNQEKMDLQKQIAKGIGSISDNQPIIANALIEMTQEAQKESTYQRKVNWTLILLSAASFIIGLIGVLIAIGFFK